MAFFSWLDSQQKIVQATHTRSAMFVRIHIAELIEEKLSQ
jgi:hypothetical protein